MLKDVLLGLMHDGSARHGYDLVVRYRQLSGTEISPGSVYRDVAALERAGCIDRRPVADGGDQRRIPYVITERGRRLFDRWLRAAQDGNYLARVPFLDLLTPAERARFLDGWRTIVAARNLAATRRLPSAPSNGGRLDPGGTLAAHRLRLLRAESELIDDVGRGLGSTTGDVVTAKVRRLALG
jgi:DNA-binding PadR family transcriptional regulator